MQEAFESLFALQQYSLTTQVLTQLAKIFDFLHSSRYFERLQIATSQNSEMNGFQNEPTCLVRACPA